MKCDKNTPVGAKVKIEGTEKTGGAEWIKQ
jgi:hypothetical protein